MFKISVKHQIINYKLLIKYLLGGNRVIKKYPIIYIRENISVSERLMYTLTIYNSLYLELCKPIILKKTRLTRDF